MLAPRTEGAAKALAPFPTPLAPQGSLHALVVFAQFKDEGAGPVPAWAADLFDPDVPGSLAHYYRTMSAGQFELTGTVLPKRYSARHAGHLYQTKFTHAYGRYDAYAEEVLVQADRDIDLGQFDNDGPDGRPNSGDDDGVVDFVFVIAHSTPRGFIWNGATGIDMLGFDPLASSALTPAGEPVQIDGRRYRSALIQGNDQPHAISAMAHELGHALDLPDLYDQEYAGPADDSAGIGRWGLMGWGALGSRPAPMSPWSREQLGWLGPANARLVEIHRDTLALPLLGPEIDEVVYKVRLPARVAPNNYYDEEYLLLEERGSGYYDRYIPGEGLLVWRVFPHAFDNNSEERKMVDLICADGTAAGDDLDAWAHDADYARAHGGNIGDATDPFDGVRHTRLTLPTGDRPERHTRLAVHRRNDRLRVDVHLPRWSGPIDGEVHWAGDILVDGDITVSPGGKLVLYTNTRIRFAARDRLRAGLDPERIELRIEGDLQLSRKRLLLYSNPRSNWGSIEPAPVVFEGISPGTAWHGLILPEGTRGQLLEAADQIVIRDALHNVFDAPAVATAINEAPAPPTELALLANFPNPFNAATTLRYTLPQSAHVQLILYNALGQQVRLLVDQFQPAGLGQAVWDGLDAAGRSAASGLYFYRLRVEGQALQSRPLLLLR